MCADRLVFPITTGRTGTVYLAELFQNNIKDAAVYHERTGPLNFGVHTPDVSHLTVFNTLGNHQKVREFWQQKLIRDASVDKKNYIEISHFLVKAGLIENLDLLDKDKQVVLIALKRDIHAIHWSFINRFDFYNTGFTWLFSLDPRYRNVILPADAYVEHGMFGYALWYIHEMLVRTEYYKILTKNVSNIVFIETELKNLVEKESVIRFFSETIPEVEIKEPTLPEKKNATEQWFFGEEAKQRARKLIEHFEFNPVAIATEYIESGKRLTHLQPLVTS